MKKLCLAAATLSALAACGDPLADVEKLSDVDLAETPAMRGVIAAPEEFSQEGGLFANLFRRPDDVQDTDQPEKVASEDVVEPAGAEPPKRGMSRWLSALGGPAQPNDTFEETSTETASLSVDPSDVAVEPADDAEKRAGLGLLRRSDGPSRSRGNVPDVEPGVLLPFGDVGRNCSVKNAELGQKIEKSGQGRGYVMYDSAPSSTGPRSFYVVGFADGCARQFTAALALFGSPSMHEQLRYGRPSEAYPYSATDNAYEKVKSSVCGVSRRKPCGNRINVLERDTVFISTYERFTDNGRWADILLHDGQVMAAAIKDL